MLHVETRGVGARDVLEAGGLGELDDAAVAGALEAGGNGGADGLGDGHGCGGDAVGGQHGDEPVVDATGGGVDGGVRAVCGGLTYLYNNE